MSSKNEKKTTLEKISLGFSIICVIFLLLKFTGILNTIIDFFK
ncbi:hypothetical protein SAMN05192538_1242 [Bacillus velezensis]|nr:hypothetical protein BCBMB205_37880 [Bacillus velezensis]ARZ60133.1 hypothetical protein BAGQ_3929 [Bacillus velezensis]SDJ30963.1 hypothetical protein SAMN05192538_1242 [Bacillus velezensis]